MRSLIWLVLLVAVTVSSRAGADDTIYRWRDAAGKIHYSNRSEAVPEGATAVELPPLPTVHARIPRGTPPPRVAPPLKPRTTTCAPPDPSGLVDAVARHLDGSGDLAGLTLLVAGVPVAGDPDAVVARVPYGSDEEADVAEQAALAYPSGAPCPRSPALARYPVATRRGGAGRDVCDDFRRAFAEVGVAVSRDQAIARSFRAIAEDFTRVAADGYVASTAGGGTVFVRSGELASPVVASAPGTSVVLPPWVVEAHIAQTAAVSAETAGLVDELTVALEEIDSAARARHCW